MAVPVTLCVKQMVLHISNTRGGVMFLLSAALLIGMQTAAEPATIQIFVPKGACAVLVNNVPVTDAEYRRKVEIWKRTQPEIHFQPDLDATYECVERALTPILNANLTKLGFVGNESFRPEPRQ